MPKTNCVECRKERREYGSMWCAKHYDWAMDNARAIAQTGMGISR